MKISSQSVRNILNYLPHKQTDKQPGLHYPFDIVEDNKH